MVGGRRSSVFVVLPFGVSSSIRTTLSPVWWHVFFWGFVVISYDDFAFGMRKEVEIIERAIDRVVGWFGGGGAGCVVCLRGV